MVAAGGEELGGLVLDATGVGAIAGVPLAAAGAATFAAGATLATAGAADLVKSASHKDTRIVEPMYSKASGSSNTPQPPRPAAPAAPGGIQPPAGAKWSWVKESMNDAPRIYQERATGHSSEIGVIKNDVKFDTTDGKSLIDAKNRTYQNFFDKNGQPMKWWKKGRDEVLRQARRQIRAAAGAPVVWRVETREAATKLETYLLDNEVTQIRFEVAP